MFSISRPTMCRMISRSVIFFSDASSEHTVVPSRSTVTVSAIFTTSRSLCEIMMIVAPSSRSSRRRRSRLSLSSSLSEDVGSSSMMIFAFFESVFAISTNCCAPTRNAPTFVVGLTSSRTFFNIFSDSSIVRCQSTSRPFINSCPKKMFS